MPGTAMMKVTMTTNMTMTTIAKMTTSTGEMVVVGLVMVVVVRLVVVMMNVPNSTPKHAGLNGRFMTASPTDAHATRHFNGEYT